MTTVWPYEVMTSIQFATFYTRCLQTTPPLSTLRMFCWPCISIHTYNENQLDPLFVLSLFRQSTSTYFGHICTPSSGGTLYIYNTYQLLYMYSIPPDDGLQIYPKYVETDWRNKLRINTASSWFLLHGPPLSYIFPLILFSTYIFIFILCSAPVVIILRPNFPVLLHLFSFIFSSSIVIMILIFSSSPPPKKNHYQREGIPIIFFLQFLRPKFCVHIFCLPYTMHVLTISYYRIFSRNIWLEIFL